MAETTPRRDELSRTDRPTGGAPGGASVTAPAHPDQAARSGQSCQSCGSPQARTWATAEGPARLCPPCATLHGIGCP